MRIKSIRLWQKQGQDTKKTISKRQCWSTIPTRSVSLLIYACSCMLLCPDPSWHLFSLRIRSATSSLSPLSLTTLETSLILSSQRANSISGDASGSYGQPHAMERYSKSSQHVEQRIAHEWFHGFSCLTVWTRENDAPREELRCRKQTQWGTCQTHKS